MNKARKYISILNQIKELISEITDPYSKMATINALLYHKMENFFWVGFYLLNNGELLVGPYQGLLACLKLRKDKGVCWAAISSKSSITVGNVEEFPGHIACSSLSKSEIVVPVFNQFNQVIGVLDVDSKELNTFDDVDRQYLEEIVHLIHHE